MGKKYTIGLDFGSLSGRALLVEVETGKEVCQSVMDYPHGVMDTHLPCGKKLPANYALQHPQDYIEVMRTVIAKVLQKSGISPQDIIGVGVDFTACTVLPIKADGTPLCFDTQYKSNPHAYVKLWKHHSAQPYADKINRIAKQQNQSFLQRYGGVISAEWLFPKIAETLDQAPDVYNAAHMFIEAGDFIVLYLTGKMRRNSCAAGYKAMYHKQDGYPSQQFFEAIDTGLAHVVAQKLPGEVFASGSKAGEITDHAAQLTGLAEGTCVATASIDAHAAMPAAGICGQGEMLMIMGTSTCHLMLSSDERPITGISGVVEDGIIQGFYGYEAGQACVGDHFNWAIDNIVPQRYYDSAAKTGLDIHSYLTQLAQNQSIGQHGLTALDWFNGVRTPLVDASKKGVISGFTLQTKAEDIYRALIEATAFGTKKIIQTFEAGGLLVDTLYACGGIAVKNPFLMQVYADVTQKVINVIDSSQAVALGSAIFAASAAGAQKGGYDSLNQAISRMKCGISKTYTPCAQSAQEYLQLYEQYQKLFDFHK